MKRTQFLRKCLFKYYKIKIIFKIYTKVSKTTCNEKNGFLFKTQVIQSYLITKFRFKGSRKWNDINNCID